MKTHKWSDIKGRRLAPERLAKLDTEIRRASRALSVRGVQFRLVPRVSAVDLCEDDPPFEVYGRWYELVWLGVAVSFVRSTSPR